MADRALLAAGGDDAPLSYVVPGTAAIRIKQIHVAYVDNGASGNWLPAVRIVSDSSHTMGLAADQGVVITGGNDASVTFFPGVKHATAGAAATGAAWGRATIGNFDAHPNVPALSSIFLPFAHFETSDSSVIDITTLSNPNDAFLLKAQGMYYMSGAVTWVAFSAPRYAIWDTGAIQVDTHGVTGDDSADASTRFTLGSWWDHDTAMVVPSSPPITASLRVFNGDAIDHPVTLAWAAVYYWPNPVPSSTI